VRTKPATRLLLPLRKSPRAIPSAAPRPLLHPLTPLLLLAARTARVLVARAAAARTAAAASALAAGTTAAKRALAPAERAPPLLLLFPPLLRRSPSALTTQGANRIALDTVSPYGFCQMPRFRFSALLMLVCARNCSLREVGCEVRARRVQRGRPRDRGRQQRPDRQRRPPQWRRSRRHALPLVPPRMFDQRSRGPGARRRQAPRIARGH
jgi:hypothetical protein